jgi:hypothetical protein
MLSHMHCAWTQMAFRCRVDTVGFQIICKPYLAADSAELPPKSPQLTPLAQHPSSATSSAVSAAGIRTR